ncbi:MAG: hypothetical protein ABI769_18060 [Pseudomonadota bacterium]
MAAEAKLDATNVVVLGAWNPAILQPQWVAKQVFGIEGDLAVQWEVSFVANAPPRFTLGDVRFMPAYDRLTLVPQGLDAAQLATCENALRTILTSLPHTPISAFGINYSFEDATPSTGLQALFLDTEGLAEAANLNFEPRAMAVQRAMAIPPYVLNFTRSLDNNGVAGYKFNFHYDVTDTAAAAELLNGALAGTLATARQILAVYDALQ